MLCSLTQLLDALKLHGAFVASVQMLMFFGSVVVASVVVACFGHLAYCEFAGTTGREGVRKVCAVTLCQYHVRGFIPCHRHDILKRYRSNDL
jgi:hypothetical protein